MLGDEGAVTLMYQDFEEGTTKPEASKMKEHPHQTMEPRNYKPGMSRNREDEDKCVWSEWQTEGNTDRNEEEMQKKVEAIIHMGQPRKQGQTALDMKSAKNAWQDT